MQSRHQHWHLLITCCYVAMMKHQNVFMNISQFGSQFFPSSSSFCALKVFCSFTCEQWFMNEPMPVDKKRRKEFLRWILRQIVIRNGEWGKIWGNWWTWCDLESIHNICSVLSVDLLSMSSSWKLKIWWICGKIQQPKFKEKSSKSLPLFFWKWRF